MRSGVQNLHLARDDSAEYAKPLELTTQDQERIQSMISKTKSKEQRIATTMPVLILDAILPKQELSIDSSDPKMARLVHYCLENNCEIGMLGVNPNTGSPLNRGVTVAVKEQNIKFSSGGGGGTNAKTVILTVTGGRRMQVQSQPWLDPSGSFYLSNVDYLDSSFNDEPALLSQEQQTIVQQLSDTVPKAMKQWTKWIIKSGTMDKAGVRERMQSLGPIPNNPTDRAFWVAAALNPTLSTSTKAKQDAAAAYCLEIRPAMLSCTNDYERMLLACQALRSSTDHLSGKQRLF
eukprot:CAMPEP_0198147962 /NCGR_PEP_ID=MMETSP1443-20131203/38840_1 /TAXON_ID=186043 /ORGANISM="Entomoneis sp., Strain CCMP2396" /LENGTH=290 /DNA_ID=CAMNT_0043812503 /DNA_START=210 /DNA_END=1085 /DNA_ORIENTATION=+